MIYLISIVVIFVGMAFTFRADAVTKFGLKGVTVSATFIRHYAWSLRLQGPAWVLFGLWILIGQFV